MIKKLLIGGAVVLALIAGGVAFLFSNIDSIIEKAIESLGPEMTGVEVKVKKVSIGLKDGRGVISGLVVGNPKGYTGPHSFSLGSIALALDPASVMKDVVVVRELTIEAPDVSYFTGPGSSNLETIQRNIDGFAKKNFGGSPAPDKAKKADSSKETRFIVEKLQIRNGKVHIGVAGKEAEVALPPINMSNVGKSKGGATGAEIASIVVKEMTTSAVSSAVRGLAQKGADTAKEAVKGSMKGLLGR
jgi:hypothetical protein